jgi:uncharacterized membrane protein YeaQ/YmgE (transglycosylase-associated protein family)
LQESAQEVIAYLQESVFLFLAIAFVAGLAADKTVAYERRSSVLFFLIIGIVGLFLGEFVLFYANLDEYLAGIIDFRIVIDFIVAYLGAFFIAAIIHFVKPT